MEANELRVALKELGHSQMSFARLLRVSPSTVRRWLASTQGKVPVPGYVEVIIELLKDKQAREDG